MNPGKIMHTGGVLGGQAETSKLEQNQPFAAKSHKIARTLVKSCVLEGFWAARLKPRKISKISHWLQNLIKLHEAW